MFKPILAFAAMSGLLSVVLGAFGAHGLKAKLTASSLATYQTGVEYQMTHSLAMLAVALLVQHVGSRPLLTGSAIAFAVGIVMFSGSLYWLALGGPRWLGPITPLGGLSFIIGWGCLFVAALRWN